MTGRIKRPCARPGCSALVVSGYCEACSARAPKKMAEKVRASAYARGYGRRWQKASTAFLLAHPLCVDPFKDHGNAPRAAEVTDHIVPHKGDMHLFWNPKNWQPLCKECHDKKTAKEDGGFGNQRRVVVEGGLEVGSAPRLSDGIPGVGSNL